ncbi:MAG: molecular chaperone HtpG [Candidatus Eiseniibacteriota bacterium]
MTEQKFGFQAEVSKLLDIVAHALYSEREVFLRELISNASDACDKLRYAALTKPELLAEDGEFRVTLSADAKARTLTVADNGIGMNRQDLIDNLGTIARSGTAAFVAGLSGDAKKDASLIGQFGVGFYASFMVADKVEVLSRLAGEAEGWRWTSDGRGEFTVEQADEAAPKRGATIILHLKKDAAEFTEPARLGRIVQRYSDHIGLPIVLKDGDKEETLNRASALWTRPKSEITEEQYAEFYHHVGHAFDKPWLTVHWKAEGKIEYTGLLFVPATRPFDLFRPEREHRVKLYVRRVFITDNCKGLVPPYLRFLRGVIDSEDLPLNISREMLQHNPVVAKIQQALVKRVLGELAKQAEKEPDAYETFWDNFGAVLKEGIYEDADRREELLGLARFATTAEIKPTSLEAYLGRMKDGQEHIYYLTGEDEAALRKSPHLEGFRARGLEVLILTDPIDEFWLPAVGAYKDKSFRSVTRGAAELDKFKVEKAETDAPEKKDDDKSVASLVALLKLSLKDAVKDVRTTNRLTDSPVCLVADERDMDIHLERLLKQHHQLDEAAKRILEINPSHGVIRALAARAGEKGAADELDDMAHLLLDQALIVEGETLPDPAAFGRRLATLMEKRLA